MRSVNTKVVKYVVSIAIISVTFCQSKQITTELSPLNSDSNLQKVFDILATQDEKLNQLHTLLLKNEFFPKCKLAITSGNTHSASKCWKELINEMKSYDQSSATEIKLLNQLIIDAYDGEKTRILTIVQFIKNNVERGSELAYSAYITLLNEMDVFGQLYFKDIKGDNGLGSGLKGYTYRALLEIEAAEGDSSPIFTQKLPSVVNSILKGKELFIRNSVTKEFLHASPASSTEVLLSGGSGIDTRYVWKLIAVTDQWESTNRELFYIENKSENKILAVDGGSVVLANATNERLKSTWAMFYIQLVGGTSGEEVVIQCSFWGIKTLALDEDDAKSKLLSLESLQNTPSAIWLLQPAK